MKLNEIFKAGALAVISFLAAAPASAATLSFASGDGINEMNSRTGANVLINVHSAWEQNHASGGRWISYADTGVNGSVTPSNVVAFPYLPTAFFFEYFYLGSETVNSAILNVWADDTAGVAVNDTIFAWPNGVQDGACAAGVIGCEPSEGLHVDISSALRPGKNILTFAVYQRAGGAFGILYDGNVVTNESASSHNPVPEPATIALMGVALLGLGTWKRRRNARMYSDQN